MSFLDPIRKIVETEFASAWGATTTVIYGNAANTQPDTEWVRVNLIWGLCRTVSIGQGNRRERQRGMLIVQVFTPKDGGEGRANVLYDVAADAFRNKQFTEAGVTVTFEAPEPAKPVENPDFMQLNANCPFYADKILG